MAEFARLLVSVTPQSHRSRWKDSPALVLISLTAAGSILVGWHYLLAASGRVSPPEQVVLTVLQPLQIGLSRFGRWVGGEWRSLVGWRQLTRENRGLRRQVAELESQNQRLLRYLEENRRLRGLLGLQPGLAARKVAAEVVAIETEQGLCRIWLGRGSNDGAEADDPVIAEEGLVGRVLRCDGRRSYVVLIIDPMSGVGARCVRSGATGIVRGMGSGRLCRLEYLDLSADVREGDTLMSSGLGGVYPKGLNIGRIVRVRKDIRRPTQIADVEPAAPLDRLDHVFILKVAESERAP